jgi:hypothetical protein
VIFVDTNLFMYAVGGEHPLRERARQFFREAMKNRQPLVTSAEVLQELMHAYIPVGRIETLDAALLLVRSAVGTVWPVEEEDVRFARLLADAHQGLGARDLLHLACCRRREVRQVRTFDRQLAGAFSKR